MIDPNMTPDDGQQTANTQPQTQQQSGAVSLDFSKAQPIAAPSQSQQSNGVSLDFSQAQPVNVSGTPHNDELRYSANDSAASIAGNVLKTPVMFLEGAGEGAFNTAAGVSDIVDRVTGMDKGPVNRFLHKQAGDDNTPGSSTFANGLGFGSEALAEFMLGDDALKGLALSDRLLKVSKVAKILESYPPLAKAVNIGINALRSGGAQAGVTFLKSGGNATQAAGQGALAGGITGLFGVGGETVNLIRNALDESGLQPALQTGIRNILSDTADRLGVSKPTAASIRDVAQQVSDSVKAKASGLYQTLDNISGGQAQRFRDAAENVSDKLREIVGLDDEREAELVKRQAEIDAAHKAMLDKLAAQGHDPNMLQQADATWKQQAALSDLSNSIRQSTTGLRPELANGAKGATTPESVNAKTLFTKINRLNDRGRLAQAIGQDNANALLQHVDAAYVQAQKIAARNAWAAKLAKVGLHATGLGALGAGYEGAKHLLGIQ